MTDSPINMESDLEADQPFLSADGEGLEEAAIPTPEATDDIGIEIDIPTTVKIGDRDFQFTSRPLGYNKMILNEILNMTKGVEQIMMIFNGKVSFKDEDGTTSALNDPRVSSFITDNSGKSFDAMVRIAQLILEPIDPSNPKAPDLSNMHLDKDYAEWNLTGQNFVEILTIYYIKDLISTGFAVKKILTLSN